MRIVAGRHRGRRLAAPQDKSIRPTADRTREALFNSLESARFGKDGGMVRDRAVLDAFAGTGALGLEALSRDAATAVFMETDRSAQNLCRQNLRTLGEEDCAKVMSCNVLHPPKQLSGSGPGGKACNLILMDPPYGKDLAPSALTALAAAGWIAPEALIVVELDKNETFTAPDGFEELERRSYGRAALVFLSFGA